MEQNKAKQLNENATEKMCSSDGNVDWGNGVPQPIPIHIERMEENFHRSPTTRSTMAIIDLVNVWEMLLSMERS